MSLKKRIVVQKRYYTGAMEAISEHRLIAEFDPFTPQQYVMTSYRLDTDIESNTGQHSRTTTLRPNPDEETNIIVIANSPMSSRLKPTSGAFSELDLKISRFVNGIAEFAGLEFAGLENE